MNRFIPAFFALLLFPLYASSNDFFGVGGEKVTDGDLYPWQVALLQTSEEVDDMEDHYCGGTLIHPNWVLSAAHCFVDKNNGVYLPVGDYVLVGEVNIMGKKHNAVGNRLIIHHLYGSATKSYDVALLRLSKPLANIPTVNLANRVFDENHIKAGQTAFSLGWGLTDPEDPESKSDDLIEVKLPIADHDECRKESDIPVPKMIICAGTKKGGQDTCIGDSGGGLFLVDVNNTDFTQVGIVSYGPTKCGKGGFGKYMKTSFVISWIEKNLNFYGDSLEDSSPCTDKKRKEKLC